jgi:hypothetical protein
MQGALKKAGFDNVTSLPNADRNQMSDSIAAFEQQLSASAGIGLFFFTGHGVMEDGKDFMIPQNVDSERIRDPDDLTGAALTVQRVREAMERAGTRNILVFDMCRSSARKLFKGLKGRKGGTHSASFATAAGESLILYAAAAGLEAIDPGKGEGMSLFTKSFVSNLVKPITLAELIRKVAVDMKAYNIKPQKVADAAFPDFEVRLLKAKESYRCPYEQFSTREVTEKHCIRIYSAWLASEAVYHDEKEFISENIHRPFAEFLNVKDQPIRGPSGFTMFNADGSNAIIVSFRGTFGFDDMYTNMKVVQQTGFEGKMHSGFMSRANAVDVSEIKKVLIDDPDKQIILTGHSLGGAVAALVTLRLLRTESLMPEHTARVSCITFGQPLVGDADIVKSVVTKKQQRHFWTIVNEEDVVPRVLLFTDDLIKVFADGFEKARTLGLFDTASKIVEDTIKDLPWWGKLTVKAARAALGWYASESVKPSPYHAFGQYLFLRSNTDRSSPVQYLDDARWVRSTLKDGMGGKGALLSAKHVEQHSCAAYTANLHGLWPPGAVDPANSKQEQLGEFQPAVSSTPKAGSDGTCSGRQCEVGDVCMCMRATRHMNMRID